MAQQTPGVQTAGAGSDIMSALGNLQTVNTQSSTPMTTMQSNSTIQVMQPPSQPQQTQYVTQPTKSQPVAQLPTSCSSNDYAQFLTKTRLQDLVREVDPTEQLDEEVEEMLLQLADDFVETTVNAACLLAKHRHANTVEVKDVQLHLERNWNMWIPGFGTDEVRPYKRATVTEAHKQRLALIRKSIKKY
ncbi:transcription initiation factor TFIID subunit 12 [Orussus abietinus]|uniref:transcription initiation factor TFIID subunit 12 n=1 Tax=Orussus abietinus TaxID=222816 RepID=UPI000625452F|nr:transcription initiation factor TFIID subunit 12 [Orussus abietinus]